MDERCLIVVGSSWGRVAALHRVLGSMATESGGCVVIVNDRRPGPSGLAIALGRDTLRRVVEAEDNPILPGTAYAAPGGYQLLVEPGRPALSTEGPVRCCRPSVGVRFESAADAYGCALVQDPATAERPAVPAAALSLTPGAMVLGLDEIGPALDQRCGSPPARIAA